MKAFIALSVSIGMIFVLISFLDAATVSGEERGMALFKDPGLGGSTTGKSCDSCHPGGKGLEKAARKSWAPGELESTINSCVTQALRGKELGNDSEEMKAIVSYIKSLGEMSSDDKK